MRRPAPATKAFAGHFVNAANPTFVLDESDVPLTPTAQADVREPISSSCIATPFNMDGQACQGGALGTPFFLFTNGTSPRGLFADAYQPDVPVTGAASAITTTAATLSGSGQPAGRRGQGVLPVRHDDRLRPEHGGADAAGGQRSGRLHGAADRAAGRDRRSTTARSRSSTSAPSRAPTRR